MTIEPSTASLLGSRIGEYQVLSLLGEGGQAKVYRARDLSLGRDVAIKILPAELSGQQSLLNRLEREAHLASALNHPNIITIYSIDRDSVHPLHRNGTGRWKDFEQSFK
jgi:serine/threonine-protein kinase